jgi:hypothetical protein
LIWAHCKEVAASARRCGEHSITASTSCAARRPEPRRDSDTPEIRHGHNVSRGGLHAPGDVVGMDPPELGWGARIRTWEWRNQNPIDYPTISRPIWKKRPKHALGIPIAWQPFPNESSTCRIGLIRQNLRWRAARTRSRASRWQMERVRQGACPPKAKITSSKSCRARHDFNDLAESARPSSRKRAVGTFGQIVALL